MTNEALVSCRPATLEDLPALRELYRRASLSNTADQQLLSDHPEFLELSGENVAAGRSRVAVLGDGTIAGFATTICSGEVVELEDIFVDPDHHRRSVGTHLVTDAAAVARRHSAHRIEVTANPAAVAFYLRNGFVAVGDMVLKYGRAVRMRLEVPELGLTRAAEQAQKAAARAGVTVTSVREISGLEELSGLFAETWGGAGGGPMNSHILRAMTLAGSYVAGAVQVGGGLVGGSAGFAAIGGGEPELHSHITAVRPAARGSGIGRALKLHQRAWSLDRGIEVVTWTFDPLVRRNAIFNIAGLAARPIGYLQNVYGNMRDDINRDDVSDRFWLRWELESDAVDAAAEGRSAGGGSAGGSGETAGDIERDARMLLSVSPSGAPELAPVLEIEPGVRYRVCVPRDIEAVRQRAPSVAAAWREETRAIFSEILESGGTVRIGASGDYVVERPADGAA